MSHLLLFAEFLSVPVSTECNVAYNSKTTEDRLQGLAWFMCCFQILRADLE